METHALAHGISVRIKLLRREKLEQFKQGRLYILTSNAFAF